MSSPSRVPEEQFRELMSVVCGPVTVVTAMSDGTPAGTTVSAFMSLSLRPPMVTLALDQSSRLLGKITAGGRFGVNILGAGQEAIALRFATKEDGKFTGIGWTHRQGLPLLDGVSGWAGCTVERVFPGGDHVIIVGGVTDSQSWGRAPLVYGRRAFGTHRALSGPITPVWVSGWDMEDSSGNLTA
jgi:flavin reductase (DIM6/NTAB) family NADH-FMN oxidoreductase RutF